MLKRLILVLSIVFIPLAGLCPPREKTLYIEKQEPINPYLRLLDAVAMVESNMDDNAYNRTEEAMGRYQIRPIRLKDYNDRTGKHITLEQCYDYEIGKMIFLYYASQYDYRDIKGICVSWNGVSKHNHYYAKIKKALI